ncbi:amidohydrolase family protein [soil metagenome]
MTQTILRGGLVLDEKGAFERRDVVIEGDRFSDAAPAADATVIDAENSWVIPGVYDAHNHITYSDFHLEDRLRHTPQESAALLATALTDTLRGGVLNLRDGGGADSELQNAVATGALAGPRLQISVDMIGMDVAGTPGGVERAVEASLAKGAQWIKLIATAGSNTPADSVLASNFSEREIRVAAELAAQGGARLMVHTWGGDSLDWAVEYGAGSIEHGIYLDASQAARIAQAGVTFVPTVRIYRDLRDWLLSGELSGVPLERITDVIASHEDAVRTARDAGVSIAMGCDYTTPQQHGTNLFELAALRRAGLSSAEVLLAATRAGADLFSDPDGGVIATGKRADAVLLAYDPADAATFERTDVVRAVVKDGSPIALS